MDLKLYLVTDRELALGRDIITVAEQAVKGGVTVVQLREKNIAAREFIELGLKMKLMLTKYGVPLIINDRVDVAMACDADGVHVGQSDMPVEYVRQLLGPDKIIGLSVENSDELKVSNSVDVDYVALSPVFATDTKKDIKQPFGLSGIKQSVNNCVHPIIGIGGINLLNTCDLIAAGLSGVAVVSAVMSATDPQKASMELRMEIENGVRLFKRN